MALRIQTVTLGIEWRHCPEDRHSFLGQGNLTTHQSIVCMYVCMCIQYRTWIKLQRCSFQLNI